MKRSILNSVFFALLFGALPLQIITIINEQWSVWFLFFLPILFAVIKSQDYLYQKEDETLFRRIPFMKGISINELDDMRDLKLIDTSDTVQTLWENIEQIRA
ncbi:MAG: 1,4-dihydroxy-2-naphthoate octaprenyltransferase [Glaciecola sp.]|jgi:1,4-dihydroxy-2-naphthoate octaprenyltransferase